MDAEIDQHLRDIQRQYLDFLDDDVSDMVFFYCYFAIKKSNQRFPQQLSFFQRKLWIYVSSFCLEPDRTKLPSRSLKKPRLEGCCEWGWWGERRIIFSTARSLLWVDSLIIVFPHLASNWHWYETLMLIFYNFLSIFFPSIRRNSLEKCASASASTCFASEKPMPVRENHLIKPYGLNKPLWPN